MEYALIKNNGIGQINEKTIPNCCIFLAIGLIWKLTNIEDYNLHANIFKNILQREVTAEEMVYAIIKAKYPEVLQPLGEFQEDDVIKRFVDYTQIKVSILIVEHNFKYDLFEEKIEPDAVIIHYPGHYECAIAKKFIT
jgi:hypothetical protein